VRGGTACYTVTANGRCNQQVVRISTFYFDGHGDPGDRWVVCHEVGHAIGLRHRNVAGRMRDGVDGSDRVYTPHDLGHINSNWAIEPGSL
jgi:hypothetical protein